MSSGSDATSTDPGGWLGDAADPRRRAGIGLSIAWSFEEHGRIGELSSVDHDVSVLGRGPEIAGPSVRGEPARLGFGPRRPTEHAPPRPLGGKALSRDALRITRQGDALSLERLGKAALRVNGRVVECAVVRPGDVVALERRLVLLVVALPESSPARRGGTVGFPFGEADANGIVGESVASFRLRDELALVGRRDGHVLLLGPSGVGKELAARAIHGVSGRRSKSLVSRNAATIPATLFDAELFGHARGYPNAGMPERRGLVGEAEGGTLFLDELGELTHELQAHLLRFLDSGELHRLGEGEARRADVRVIGATNRDESALKADVLARFPLRLAVPGLDERRADVPLLVRHLLRTAAQRDEIVRERFVDPETGDVRLDPLLVEALLLHTYTTHVRELSLLLSTSIAESVGGYLGVGPRTRARLVLPKEEPSDADIRSALSRTKGNVSRAAEELGLASREVLYRLMRQHGIQVDRKAT